MGKKIPTRAKQAQLHVPENPDNKLYDYKLRKFRHEKTWDSITKIVKYVVLGILLFVLVCFGGMTKKEAKKIIKSTFVRK